MRPEGVGENPTLCLDDGEVTKMSFCVCLVMIYEEFPWFDFIIPYKSDPAITFHFPKVPQAPRDLGSKGALKTYQVHCPQMIYEK